MFVFLMVSTSTVVILVNGLQALRENSDRVEAANVARSEIEYLRDLARNDPGILPIGQFTGAIPPQVDVKYAADLSPNYLDPILRTTRYTIKTTSQWVDFASSAAGTTPKSACDATSVTADFLRVVVTVSSPTLKKPVSLQTNITQQTKPASATTPTVGATAITIVNQASVPVGDVVVTFSDAYHPENARPAMTTGFDGCLFVPGLTPTASLMVSISRPGYVSSTPTGTSKQLSISANVVSKIGFEYAPAASLRFSGLDPDFVLPADTPVKWQVKGTGGSQTTAQLTDVVTGLWPGNEVQAWAGGCADADPGSSRPSYALVGGGTTVAGLMVAPVRIVGLKPSQDLIALHTVGGCTVTEALGKANENGVVRVGMPYGQWSFKAAEETVALETPLAPPAPGSPASVVTVTFLLQVDLKPTPTPTPTPTDGSGSPSPSPTDPSSSAPAPSGTDPGAPIGP